MKINGNEIRPGNVIQHKGGLWVAVKTQAVKPGKGPAYQQVELKDLVLEIRGTKKRLESEPAARRFHLMERFMGSFQLSVELPRPIHPSQSTAELRHGMLIVTLPKVVDRRHRSFVIPIVEESTHHE